VFGLAMSISGLVILTKYHMGHEGLIITTDSFFTLDYFNWTLLHKVTVIAFFALTLLHIVLHWKWYKNTIRKKLFKKNLQVYTLSVLFILVAISGFVPWLIQICEGSENSRKVFLETHDKLGLLLFIYLIIHVVKRARSLVSKNLR
jgi:hypothetical protein